MIAATFMSVVTSWWFWFADLAVGSLYFLLLLIFEGKDIGKHPLEFSAIIVCGILSLPSLVVFSMFITLFDVTSQS